MKGRRELSLDNIMLIHASIQVIIFGEKYVKTRRLGDIFWGDEVEFVVHLVILVHSTTWLMS
jgi:hypothetical protein